ncbi:MAG: flagellar biosynthetic protein FliO [Alicyclobacillaceae bacterium]|nr:flagellar biosynthetic protein FliO [Alicyclobacillaceae bacterium]
MGKRWPAVAITAGLVVFLSLPTVQAAGAQTPLGSPWHAVFNLVVSLAAVIALAIAGIRFLARRSSPPGGNGIDVVAWRQVAPNRSVQVIEVGGRRLLIGVGEQVTLLADLTHASADAVAAPDQREAEVRRRFARALQQAFGQAQERHWRHPQEAVD